MIGTALRKAAPDAKDRLLGILFYYHSDLTEFALSLFALASGLWLLLPLPLLATRQAVMEWMAQLGPEELWGLALVALGLAQFAAWLTGHPRSRRWLSLLGFFVWTAFTLACASDEPGDLAVPLYAVVALMSALSYLHNGGTRE